MDRNRLLERAKDLRACAELIGSLTQMPDRAAQKDFQRAGNLMEGAAGDLETLVRAQLPGCICHRIQGEDYDYLDYAEGCLHHRQLYTTRERLKADYAKMEEALKNEARMRLVTAALSGSTGHRDPRDTLTQYAKNVVERAITIADETIRQIVKVRKNP